MAARRGRRDRVVPPPSGGPGPDPGGGVRGSSRGARSLAPYETVGTVSGGEQVRSWRAARGWQQSGVCRAVTRGRYRKGRKRSGLDAGCCGRQVGPSGPEPFAGGTQAEAGSLWPFLRNAGGAQSGVGNPAHDWREEEGIGLGVKG